MERCSRGLARYVWFVLPLFLACPLGPDDVLYVSGRLAGADGEGLSGVEVALRRNPVGHCYARSSPYFQSTKLEPDDVYSEFRSGESDDRGGFLFELLAGETTVKGRAACFELSAGAAEGGAEVEGVARARFQLYSIDGELEPLRVWNERVAVSPGQAGHQLTLSSLPSLTGSTETQQEDPTGRPLLSYRWMVESGSAPLWGGPIELSPDARPALELPDYLLEDFSAVTVVARAVGEKRDQGPSLSPMGTFTYSAEAKTPAVPLASPGRIPVSRGARCAQNGAILDPCPLTDGKLELVLIGHPQLYLVLDAPRRLSRVVLRDLYLVPTASSRPPVSSGESGPQRATPAFVSLEGSADSGATWVSIRKWTEPAELSALAGLESPWFIDAFEGQGWGSYLDVPVPASLAAVDRVRLVVGEGGTVQAVRELSLFE